MPSSPPPDNGKQLRPARPMRRGGAGISGLFEVLDGPVVAEAGVPSVASARALDVVQGLLREQCVTLCLHVDGVRHTAELGDAGREAAVIHLHQLRVALRRTRSVLSQLRAVFPAAVGRRFRRRLRWISRISGPVRDLDVWSAALHATLATLSPADRADLVPLVCRIERRRAAAQITLMAQFDRKRLHQTLRDWQVFVVRPYTEPDRPAAADDAIAGPASAAIAQLYGTLVQTGARVTPQSADGAVHAVRILVKKLRYLVKLFGPLISEDTAEISAPLRRLQRCLGSYNDHSVQLLALQRMLPELMAEPLTTPNQLVAIGQIMGRLSAEKEVERQRFIRRMAVVAAAEMQARYVAAFGGPVSAG